MTSISFPALNPARVATVKPANPKEPATARAGGVEIRELLLEGLDITQGLGAIGDQPAQMKAISADSVGFFKTRGETTAEID